MKGGNLSRGTEGFDEVMHLFGKSGQEEILYVKKGEKETSMMPLMEIQYFFLMGKDHTGKDYEIDQIRSINNELGERIVLYYKYPFISFVSRAKNVLLFLIALYSVFETWRLYSKRK